jgi:hypothetical protein
MIAATFSLEMGAVEKKDEISHQIKIRATKITDYTHIKMINPEETTRSWTLWAPTV